MQNDIHNKAIRTSPYNKVMWTLWDDKTFGQKADEADVTPKETILLKKQVTDIWEQLKRRGQ